MTRFSSSLNSDAASAVTVWPVLLADFDLPSGHWRYNSSDRTLSFGGYDYTGLGDLASVSPVIENSTLVPEKVSFVVAGVSNTLITAVLADKYHGRAVSLYLGFFNLTTCALVDTPYLLWEGRMDVMSIDTGPNVSTIEVICENRLILWDKSPGWLYTTEHHATLMGSGDNFFDQVQVIANQIIKWGGGAVFSGVIYGRNGSSGSSGGVLIP